MFESKETPNYQRSLESELERVIVELRIGDVVTEDYAKTLTVVERLHKLMDKEKPSRVSKETMLTVGANLLGIILIISHEHIGNAVTTKALGFVLRPR